MEGDETPSGAVSSISFYTISPFFHEIIWSDIRVIIITWCIGLQERYYGEKKFKKNTKKIPQIRKISLANKDEKPSAFLDINDPIKVKIELDVHKKTPNLVVGIKIISSDGSILLVSEDRDLRDKERINYSPGSYRGQFEISQNIVNIGKYTVYASCKIVSQREKHSELLDEQEAFQFECVDGLGKIKRSNPGLLAPLYKWNIVKGK